MPKITAEQLNAFVAPSVEVIERLARIPAQVGTLRRERRSIPLDTLVILIGVRGDLSGDLLFHFDPPILTQILRVLLGGVPPPFSDPLCLDAMGEVANMIAGHAAGRLETIGFQTTITPPRVLNGQEANRRMMEKEGIVIPIQSAIGEIGVSIFLETI